MLRAFRADLHIHSCLSPCSCLDMSPFRIAREAARKGLDIIAVTDHNAAENSRAAIAAAANAGIYALAGIEICTAEDVHLLALFDKWEQAVTVQAVLYEKLQPGVNNPDTIGMQVIADEFDEVTGMSDRLLIGSVRLSIDEAVGLVHENGGLAIACHVDREAFGIIGQLGFIPPGLALDAVELSHRAAMEAARRIGLNASMPVIRSSDAHLPEDIGRASTVFHIESPTISEIRLALRNECGRRAEPVQAIKAA